MRVGLVIALGALSFAALALTACGGSRPIAYTDLTKETGALEFTRISVRLFDERDDLRDFLARMNPGRPVELPAVDFEQQEVYLVAAGPRSSTGYELRVLSVRDEGGRIVVRVRERTPTLGEPVQARVTYPYRLLALPRSDKPVKLKWLGRP